MTPTVKVDATQAFVRFSDSGIPAAVRANLRRVIPDLTRRLGAAVDANMAAGLKSRNRLETKVEMIENPTTIYGRVRVIATSPPALLPLWLESGTKPHEIAARNAPALTFFWPLLGRTVSFRKVWHPGFAGIFYMEKAYDGMQEEIVSTLEGAVRSAGAR